MTFNQDIDFSFSLLPARINLSFWNSGLTPPVAKCKGKCTEQKLDLALQVIDELVSRSHIVGICELYSDNIVHISKHLGITHPSYKILDLVKATSGSQIGQSWFDFGLIYNADRFTVSFESAITARFSGQEKLRAGLMVKVTEISNGNIFCIYLCHWQSRLSGNEKERIAKATRIADLALEQVEKGNQVIAMGDFNDEPANESLLSYMLASKCYSAVRKKPESFFYNPFARVAYSAQPYCYMKNKTPKIVGSYYHASTAKQPQCYYMFDQIVFSSCFVTDKGPWYLDEQESKVLELPIIKNELEKSKRTFDHYPVFSSIINPIFHKAKL